MKANDILKESEISSESCGICELHRIANEKLIDGVICPYCGHSSEIDLEEYKVVGETNSYNPEEKIGKYLVVACMHCGEYYALMPEKINYNANHDIYYTGGKEFLNDDDHNEIFVKAEEAIKASLKQWVDRYERGDKLDPMYPALWIKRDITSAIADYLYQKGFKK